MSTNEPPPIPPCEQGPVVRYATPNTPSPSNGRDKLIADTVIGPNLRWKDNLIQAVVIAACTVAGPIIAMQIPLLARSGMAVLGGLMGGLLLGLFGSGIFLMIYRGVRHMRGKHD